LTEQTLDRYALLPRCPAAKGYQPQLRKEAEQIGEWLFN